jgi:hypothetical protein
MPATTPTRHLAALARGFTKTEATLLRQLLALVRSAQERDKQQAPFTQLPIGYMLVPYLDDCGAGARERLALETLTKKGFLVPFCDHLWTPGPKFWAMTDVLAQALL